MTDLSKPTTFCLLCNEEVDPDGDSSTTALLSDGKFTERYVHRECNLREVIGGIGHLEDHKYWCKEMKDPDGGRTRRQSAIEVDQWVAQNGVQAAVAKGSAAFH